MPAPTLADRHAAELRRLTSTARRDLLVIVAIFVVTCIVSFRFSAFDHLPDWSQASANKGPEKFIFVPVIAVVAFAVFAYRRWRELE